MPVVLIIAAFILFIVIPLIFKGIITLVKHIFENPVDNSLIAIILDILIVIGVKVFDLVRGQALVVLIIVYLLAIVDCIRDLIMADQYYSIDENWVDKFFLSKSILSFFTLGSARAVYILIICPIIALHARHCVKSTLKKEKIVSEFTTSYGYHGYKMRKYVEKCLVRGTILENKSTVAENTQISGQKIAGSTPTKFVPKIAEIITSDGRHRKKQRERDFMTNLSERHAWVYIDGSYFLKCRKTFSEFMSSQGMLSIVDIVRELKNANLIDEIRYKDDDKVKFFVAYVLDMLVLLGKLEAADVSDDIFDNRQYRHVSGKQVTSIDLSDDPNFAL